MSICHPTLGPNGVAAGLPDPAARLRALHGRVLDRLRAAACQWRLQRDRRATAQALESLDARTLHDLGLDRAEIGSAAAELHGCAMYTRLVSRVDVAWLA